MLAQSRPRTGLVALADHSRQALAEIKDQATSCDHGSRTSARRRCRKKQRASALLRTALGNRSSTERWCEPDRAEHRLAGAATIIPENEDRRMVPSRHRRTPGKNP